MTFFESDRQELKRLSRVVKVMDKLDTEFRTEVRASLTRIEARLREGELSFEAGETLGAALQSLAQEEAMNRKERHGKESGPVIGPGSRVEREEKTLAERSADWVDSSSGLSIRIGILCPARRSILFVSADEYKLNDLPAGTIPLQTDLFNKFYGAVHEVNVSQVTEIEFSMTVQCTIGDRHPGKHFAHLWHNEKLGEYRDSINAEWG